MRILLTLFCLVLFSAIQAQNVYVINADSVKITNCDSAELIIENHTQGIPGFLFNTGNGRTQFRRALLPLGDTAYLVGADTLHVAKPYWALNGTGIYNLNTGNVGIHRQNPVVTLDLPGPVNIDDSSAYRINYHPILSVSSLQPGAYWNAPGDMTYANLYVGDSAGNANTGTYTTCAGNFAGASCSGQYTSHFGYMAGYGSIGDDNTNFGAFAGLLNTANPITGNATDNTCIGYSAGGSAGGFNTSVGSSSGNIGVGDNNTFFGFATGVFNQGDGNCLFGSLAGGGAVGAYNCFMGFNAGDSVTGSSDVYLGNNSGSYGTGSKNVFIGDSTGGNSSWSGLPLTQNWDVFIGANSWTSNATGVTLVGAQTSSVGRSLATNVTTVNATAIGYQAVVNNSNTMVFGNTSVQNWLLGTSSVVSGEALVVGSNSSNGNGAYLTAGGVWTNACDSAKKENFRPIVDSELLAQIDRLPVTRWNYKGLQEQHIGPVAQDFYRIFHVGNDDKTISTIDPAGIALAGVQGLHQQIKDMQAEIDSLKAQLQHQKEIVKKVSARMTVLEASITNPASQTTAYAKQP